MNRAPMNTASAATTNTVAERRPKGRERPETRAISKMNIIVMARTASGIPTVDDKN